MYSILILVCLGILANLPGADKQPSSLDMVKSDCDSKNDAGVIYNVSKSYFDVQCKHNSLRIHRIQLEGKKVMDSKDFILGYQSLDSSSLL